MLDGEDRVRLEVGDEGPGIPEEVLDKVFERFYRVPGAPSGGTGLGLSIAGSIAEAHGGRIELESTPGRGSIFRVYLPLKS